MIKDDTRKLERDLGLLEAVEASEHELQYVDCPRESCGETIMLTEFEGHMSMHDVENSNEEISFNQKSTSSKRPRGPDSESEPKFDTRLPPALRNLAAEDPKISSSSSGRQTIAKVGWRELFNMPTSRAKSQISPEPKKKNRRLGVSFLVC